MHPNQIEIGMMVMADIKYNAAVLASHVVKTVNSNKKTIKKILEFSEIDEYGLKKGDYDKAIQSMEKSITIPSVFSYISSMLTSLDKMNKAIKVCGHQYSSYYLYQNEYGLSIQFTCIKCQDEINRDITNKPCRNSIFAKKEIIKRMDFYLKGCDECGKNKNKWKGKVLNESEDIIVCTASFCQKKISETKKIIWSVCSKCKTPFIKEHQKKIQLTAICLNCSLLEQPEEAKTAIKIKPQNKKNIVKRPVHPTPSQNVESTISTEADFSDIAPNLIEVQSECNSIMEYITDEKIAEVESKKCDNCNEMYICNKQNMVEESMCVRCYLVSIATEFTEDKCIQIMQDDIKGIQGAIAYNKQGNNIKSSKELKCTICHNMFSSINEKTICPVCYIQDLTSSIFGDGKQN